MHSHLLKNSQWYAKWHRHPLHKTTHWASFIAVAVIAAVLLVANINLGLEYGQTVVLASAVPPEYQDIYTDLAQKLDDFDANISAQWDGSTYPSVFSTELTAANGNQGSQLLAVNGYQAALIQLDRLKGMGLKAVTVSIGFPMLDPNFITDPVVYQQYVNYYKNLANDIRARGLKLIVESQAIFPGYSSWDVNAYYRSLSFDEYKAGRLRTLRVITREMHPDFLTVINEPDTETSLTGHEVTDPVIYTSFVEYLSEGVKADGYSAGVNLGAGFGTWTYQYREYAEGLAGISALGHVDIHIYPIHRDFLTRIFEVAELLEAHGKTLGIGEAWLNKDRDSELGVINEAVDPTIRARNVFSFWAPLDQKFIDVIKKLANYKRISYVSPYWSTYFFAYLENEQYKNLTPPELITQVNLVAGNNILNGIYTDTGIHYAKALDSLPPNAPTSLLAQTASTTKITLTWNAAVENTGVAVYKVFRDGNQIGTTNQTFYFNENLTPATFYTYTVMAQDVAGNASLPSAPSSATTFALPDKTPPTAPSNLTAVAAITPAVQLFWEPSIDNVSIKGYKVFRNGNVIVGNLTSNSYIDTKVYAGQAYTYEVQAFDPSYNYSAKSNPVSVTVPKAIKITYSGASTQSTSATINWYTNVPATGVIYYGASSNNLNQRVDEYSAVTIHATNISNLSADTTYYYQITAMSQDGLSTAVSPVGSFKTRKR